MTAASDLAWSGATDAADWIGPRLDGFGTSVTSVIPSGFEAYARVLHPAGARIGDDGAVRWREVAAWSGRTVQEDAQFHSVAFPSNDQDRPRPWHGQGPAQGTLFRPDARQLVEHLRRWTATPDRCCFLVWDGYGWSSRTPMVAPGATTLVLPDPVPEWVRSGPKVKLPHRGYFLLMGPIEAVVTKDPFVAMEQTPNLWWPIDRTWCVASEIDLAWTYVGGSAEMIGQILADDRMEVLAAESNDPIGRTEPWLDRWIDEAVDKLWDSGHTTGITPLGTVEAELDRPGRFRTGELRTRTARTNGGGTGRALVGNGTQEEVKRTVMFQLQRAVIGLAEG